MGGVLVVRGDELRRTACESWATFALSARTLCNLINEQTFLMNQLKKSILGYVKSNKMSDVKTLLSMSVLKPYISFSEHALFYIIFWITEF